MCCECLCVCQCVISNQSTSKKSYYVSGLSKLDTLLHKTHIKVLLALRYQCSTCVHPLLSLSKIAHQMWRNHPFSHRNRTMERTVGVGVGGDREVGWGNGGVCGKNLKKGGGRQYRGIFMKYGGWHPSANYIKRL